MLRRETFFAKVQTFLMLCADAQMERIYGMRCWVKGAIQDPGGMLLATCDAQLADLQQLWKLQK